MSTGSCPTCGTARVGSFRYCRSCGLDYDAAEPKAPTPAPEILAPVPEVAPAAPAIPAPVPESAPAVLPVANDVQQQPAGDVIVIQVQQLKLWAGVIVGGIIGMMLAGAIVVPFFGEGGVLLGSVAGIVVVVVSAWLGMRFVRLTAKRRPAVGSVDPG